MKIDPITVEDLGKVFNSLPQVDKFPAPTVAIPFKDQLTGEQRDLIFTKRKFVKDGVEQEFWVHLCFVASKGVR